MIDLSFKYKDAISFLLNESPFIPEIAVVLGSGLGNFAESTEKIKSVSTSVIPNYPLPSVEGHKGMIHFSKINEKKVLIFQGRNHFYEGYGISDCILPVLLTKKINCKKIIFTNAAGGVNINFRPGDLMLVESFNSINLKKELAELIGISSVESKNNFLNCPSERMNKVIRLAAKENLIELQSGIYWYSKGPSYETPAEIKMIEKFGGDAAGMSTVHEAVYASFIGMELAIISCITNMAAGILPQKLSHQEVTETANQSAEKFTILLKSSISRL
ncbi:MAG: purine-nucleoside phosphorylase [Ignavibacteriota bacterium]|jgi:purine-nucleoside phosphorylase|nr:MAG: purine-nucleoside phosphorylase [Chlorobiota bacterium]MBE7477216.1 purine-nucleoside phosphorylase [Ignavibacteriales bacterium]MBL1122600.1 purine-nucleoside phosphorylase [Ignavibacteriota bacterium]MCC7092747.1 purine-nucleoside phosphorylase [Ignavibacteriaceae bacterium]MCE7856319.1 purine-nucleoside phosphorylase [Ignavibacteria bacterium CHB3]MEB2297024.1 purine-nucleoside phosphorylase [Ignavibacteria bacterium]